MLRSHLEEQVRIYNRCYYFIHRSDFMKLRHECPTLAIYGHCGKSEACSHCTVGKE